jgi:hypothetical protein
MNEENQKYLADLPLRLMTLAALCGEHPEVTVKPKVIQGQPGFEFTFPPDHTDHDSTFHAPHPQDYELHVLSAQHYVKIVEDELQRLITEKREHQAQLALGHKLLSQLSTADVEALKLVIK